MATGDDSLSQSLDAHLDVEQSVLRAVCDINDAMAGVLSETGIKGPSEDELKKLEPLMVELQKRSRQSLDSRRELIQRFDRPAEDSNSSQETAEQSDNPGVTASLFARLSRGVPADQRSRLDQRRRSLTERLATAQATLASNQALVYYSMDFHRRYLMGVLQHSDQSGQNVAYSAEGQAFSPQPETLFGRNC